MFTINKEGEIVKYEGELKEISIPDFIHDIEVKSIGKDVFKNKNIEKISLPNTLKKIGEGTFKSQDRKLKRVIILGDEHRFDDMWFEIGFPKKLFKIK
jgi:hypothetical protein